jgi:nitroimidazol reductase NimA-like FMN-containing flavoprotein (pyridoxamine 5'-phosphate oxidase superfamily)
VSADTEKLVNKIESLFQSQSLGVLATRGKEYPYCTLVGFAGTDDMRRIIFATLRNTRKYANIKKYPMISILIDSRSNRVEDFKDAMALTVLGTAHEAEGEERERLSGLYLARHPHLKEFLRDPDCALMVLEVERYILVTRFQQVMEMDVSPCR